MVSEYEGIRKTFDPSAMRTRTNKRWTQREIDYIREKYPTTKRYTIAFDLGVTMQVLDAAIKRHGLRKMPRIKDRVSVTN